MSEQTDTVDQSRQYQMIARAIRYLQQHQQTQPSLAEVAQYVGLSEYHFQRLFSQWVGISPKQYLQFLTRDYARQCLQSSTVLASSLAAGLSSASRLHDLMVKIDAVTPGDIKKAGAGLDITYGYHDSPFGECLLATTPRGVCSIGFYDTLEQQQALLDALCNDWAAARIRHDQQATARVLPAVFNCSTSKGSVNSERLNVLLKGTAFQIKVWEALLQIPSGQRCSYQQLADAIDAPTSVRAVASAVAKNNIAYLIPCHRVIKTNGESHHYRWGSERKQLMLGWESAHQS